MLLRAGASRVMVVCWCVRALPQERPCGAGPTDGVRACVHACVRAADRLMECVRACGGRPADGVRAVEYQLTACVRACVRACITIPADGVCVSAAGQLTAPTTTDGVSQQLVTMAADGMVRLPSRKWKTLGRR